MRGRRAATDGAGLATSAGISPEAFWDLHGASLYALACALLGDEAAALRAVSLAMVDLYSPSGSDAEGSLEVTSWSAAACVYNRCQADLAETPVERTMTTPPLVVWLGGLARGQRAALALCVFGGHTYDQVATRLDLAPDVAADLVTSGLRDLLLATRGTELHNVRVLEDSLDAFTRHLRTFGETGLATAVDGVRDGDPARLPQRVLSLFTRGMGGLLDRPLYLDGKVDLEATRRRDALADDVHSAAVARLGRRTGFS